MYWLPIGFGLGLLLGAFAAWKLSRRQLRTVRFAERRARQAERMAEIGAMTGGLAHEIKNPLSTIGLNAQLLSEAIDELAISDDDKKRLVHRIRSLRREAERLKGILQDFLEYAGQVRLAPAEADVNSVLRELVDFFQPEAERHGVRILLDLAPSGVNATFDIKLIKQALLNLMLNATQAMAAVRTDPGEGQPGAPAGELILRTRSGEDEQRNPVVRISVIDTGPGMKPDVLAQIFNPYFTTKAGGSGLGLPTARRLVEEHGGRLDVHSEPGKGTEFTLTLLVTLRTATPAAPVSQASPPAR